MNGVGEINKNKTINVAHLLIEDSKHHIHVINEKLLLSREKRKGEKW